MNILETFALAKKHGIAEHFATIKCPYCYMPAGVLTDTVLIKDKCQVLYQCMICGLNSEANVKINTPSDHPIYNDVRMAARKECIKAIICSCKEMGYCNPPYSREELERVRQKALEVENFNKELTAPDLKTKDIKEGL